MNFINYTVTKNIARKLRLHIIITINIEWKTYIIIMTILFIIIVLFSMFIIFLFPKKYIASPNTLHFIICQPLSCAYIYNIRSRLLIILF